MRSKLTAITALLVAPTLAAAQESGPGYRQLEEVVVTAQRREQALQNVPISISAIGADTLQNSGIDTITSLSAVVPGLDVPMVGSVSSPYLRGIGSNAADPNNEPSVAMYIDGIYIAAPFSNVFSFNNIERVEVLKGPQGTLFGRNATGGVIQIITREPTQEAQLEAALSYGNYQASKVDLYGSAGITPIIAADLALQYEDQGEGWGRNVVLGHETYIARQHAARSKFVITPAESTRVIVGVDYAKRKSSISDYQLGEGVAGLDGAPHWHGRHDVANNRKNVVDAETLGGSVRIEQGIGDIEFISMTAYRENEGSYHFDADATPVDFVTALLDQEATTFTQEFQLAGSGARYDWLVGAFYFDNTAEYNPGTLSGLAIGPAPLVLFGQQETESWSLYGQSTFALTGRLKGTLGLRYTDEEQTFNSAVGGAALPSITKGFDKFTWRVALDYDLSDEMLVYISYNRGLKSGGFDILSPGNVGYDPEILDAWEVGLKSQLFDSRVRLNAAAFWYDYQDMQVTSIQQNTTTTANAASATIRGAEFDIEALLSQTVTLNAGAAWLDGEYDDFDNPVVYPRSPGEPPVVLPSAKGNATIRTPELTGYVGIDYRRATAYGLFSANVTVSYNDGYYWAPDERFAQDAYTLVSGTIGWQTSDERIGISLWGANLTDEEYLIQGVPSAYGDLSTYAAPRTYGIRITSKL